MSDVKPISDQCAALGWRIEELLGKTARECRALGFEIPPNVGDERELVATDSIDEGLVETHVLGRTTGYAWMRAVTKASGN